MAWESLTDERIEELLSTPKRILNPGARRITKPGHWQKNFNVLATDGSVAFTLFVRQNSDLAEDFSVGLRLDQQGTEPLMLVRYNGPNHDHPNKLEGTKCEGSCHIHKATQRYIQAGRKPEGFAESTERYRTNEGALSCLVKDCNISGINPEPDNTNQTELFGSW